MVDVVAQEKSSKFFGLKRNPNKRQALRTIDEIHAEKKAYNSRIRLANEDTE